METDTNELGQITKVAVMPIYGRKPFNNLLLQNQWTGGLEIWYVALDTQVLSRLFK